MRGSVLVRLLPLLFSHALAAPRADSRSEQSDVISPFSPGEEHLRFLQSYLQEIDPLGEKDPNMSRETAILRLFALHDYDKNGQLDGLELMHLLHGVLVKSLKEIPTEDLVISVVDDVLEKQDGNHDGLLSAQELVNSLSYKDKEGQDTAQVAIPPPMGVPIEDLPAPVDFDPSNKEKLEIQHPEEDNDLPLYQTNDPAPPPAETVSSQEEQELVHDENVVEEVPGEVEAVEMPREEEDDKVDDEM
ncbi:cell growth regulator with EF hand domain protein 1 [Engystomops pustulosus]|uniref:cell growth regulator with EF hand domain protein 1 n=1 Tax=Engystomops pustulosus TaxID=76066 RepID=UPI003AFAE184